MASPLIFGIPALMNAAWEAILSLFRWFLSHLHIAKFVVVAILTITAFWVGTKIYTQLVSYLNTYMSSLGNNLPSGVSVTLDILAKANYCLPVSEMLALLTIYCSAWGICMVIRFMLSMYRTLPFKRS